MQFSTLRFATATVGMAALALAIAVPASAQQAYGRPRHHHHRTVHPEEGRQIVVHAAQPPAPYYGWGPGAAVGNVVSGTGQAAQSVFTGAGGVVGGVVGGVLGGVTALFSSPSYSAIPAYAYGSGGPAYAPGASAGGPIGAAFAAPFNAAGAVVAAPFQVVGGAFGGMTTAGPAMR